MHRWAREMWPFPRSLTGEGVRQTLAYLKALLPDLTTHSVPSGYQAFDWIVPDEWAIREAYIADESGARLIDFAQNNLHVLGYSTPIDATLTRAELEPHLHALPDQPDAIPYMTSYYAPRWGFCLSQNQRAALGQGPFRVRIDSRHFKGRLDYADLIIPGESGEEILFSTYVCHPAMANNELSGPVVCAALAQWIAGLPKRRYTYRFVFAPETIGPLVYMSTRLDHLQAQVKAGFVVTCVGDERAWSLMPSRRGDTLADRAARHVLKHHAGEYVTHSFLQRGSDERQYCAPLIDLPVCSIMRSRYGLYPEYHTSLDDLSLITQEGLEGSLACYQKVVRALEANQTYVATTYGEPQLGRRGLYPMLSAKRSTDHIRGLINFLAYCDGREDLLAIAETIGVSVLDCAEYAAQMEEHGLVRAV